jgi:hypothetical protein
MSDLIRHPAFLDIFWIPGRALLARDDRKRNYSKLSTYLSRKAPVRSKMIFDDFVKIERNEILNG